MNNSQLLKQSLKNGCPKCGKPNIFPHRLTLDVKNTCDSCGFKIANHDSGDGPAFFVLSALCIIMTPLALWLAAVSDIPLWGHAIIWSIICIGFCILTLQPLKAYFIALNYKHRGGAKGV